MNCKYVVILNWNSAEDSVECINSVFEVDRGVKVIVADNNSKDDSVSVICNQLRGAGINVSVFEEFEIDGAGVFESDVLIIKNGSNYGFAGGNNVALRYIQKIDPDCYVWLLNSDARPGTDSISALTELLDAEEDLAFAGSVILDYEDRDLIQCFGGGVSYLWLGKSKLYFSGRRVSEISEASVFHIDYLMGASLMIRMAAIKDVGLMPDEYFMYSEEVDWQFKAKQLGWRISVSPNSFIYHKGSQSTKGRSFIYHYYINRAGIIFSKKFGGRAHAFMASIFLSLYNLKLIAESPKSYFYSLIGVIHGLTGKRRVFY